MVRIFDAVIRWFKAEWHLGRGVNAVRCSLWSRGIKHLDRTLELRPNSIGVREQLALALYKKGIYKKARSYLLHSLGNEPHGAAHYLICGKIYCRQELWKEAEKALKHALSISPCNVVATSWLSLTELKLGNAEKAAVRINETYLADDGELVSLLLCELENITLDTLMTEDISLHTVQEEIRVNIPKSFALAWVQGFFLKWLGGLLLILGQVEPGIQKLRSALTYRPDDDDVAVQLAMTYMDKGKFSDAMTTLRNVSDTSSEYELVKGAALVMQGHGQLAQGHLELADELMPETHYYRGLATTMEGDMKKSVRFFREAYRLDPALIRERVIDLAVNISDEHAD